MSKEMLKTIEENDMCRLAPPLGAVAKDILSIPGSSVSVERIFNCGRDVIGLRRHSLKPETFSALMFGKYNLNM